MEIEKFFFFARDQKMLNWNFSLETSQWKSYEEERLKCKVCPAGTISAEGASGVSACETCPVGAIASFDRTACEVCPAGTTEVNRTTCMVNASKALYYGLGVVVVIAIVLVVGVYRRKNKRTYDIENEGEVNVSLIYKKEKN